MEHIMHLKKFLRSAMIILTMLLLVSCDSKYYTPKEAMETGNNELKQGSEYELVDKEIAIIDQTNYALYLYVSHDIIVMSYLEVDDSSNERKYNCRAYLPYYSIKDITGKIDETVLLDGNRIFSTLSTKFDKKAYAGYTVKSYDITAYGTTKTYYLIYK